MDFQSDSNDRDLEPAIVATGEYELGSIIIAGATPNIDRLDDSFICIDELSSSIASIRALIETREGIIAVVNRAVSPGWGEPEARARKRSAEVQATAKRAQPQRRSAGSVQ